MQLSSNPFKQGLLGFYSGNNSVDSWHHYGSASLIDAPCFEFTILDHEPFERNTPLPVLDRL